MSGTFARLARTFTRTMAGSITICAAAASMSLGAQTTVVDVNPSRSTLDASDPDGATGGRTNALARASARTYFAATEWGGLYKTNDTGRTWSHLAAHLPMATTDIKVDQAMPTRIFATSLYDGRVNSRAGINVSNDGGTSWAHPATALPPAGLCAATRRDEPSAFAIAIDASSRVYVGTNCGLARSVDGGVTWTYIDPTPADPAGDVRAVIVHHGKIDICGDDGHLRSSDGGTTWTTSSTAPLPSGRCALAASPDEAYALFAVVGTTLYETLDSGTTWAAMTLANPAPQGRVPFVRVNDRAGSGFDLWFGDVSLWRTGCSTPPTPTPGGTTRCAGPWSTGFTRGAGAHDDAGDIAFYAAAADACPALFASDGGIFRNTLTTSPGCQSPAWEQPDITPHALWLYGMHGAHQPGVPDEDIYVGAQDNGVFGATNGGASLLTWTNQNCCDGFSMHASATRVVYTDCCYFPAPANRVFLGGRGFSGVAEINAYPPGNVRAWIKAGVIAQFAPDGYAVVTTSGVFITANIGAAPISWTRLGPSSPVGASAVKVASTGGVPTFYVQAGTGDGRGLDQLWRFNGTSGTGAWTQIQPPGNVGGFGIFDVTPDNPNRLIASHLQSGVNPAMIMSTDGGATWTGVPALDAIMTDGGAFRYRTQRGPFDWNGLSGYPQPTLVAFDPARPAWIVAGANDAGVFLSTDNGATWNRLTDPNTPATSGVAHLPRPLFAHFDHDGSNVFTDQTRLFVGTQGRGVWRIDRTEHTKLISICEVRLRLCPIPGLAPGRITLNCDKLPCFFRDPVPRNCLIKYACNPCSTVALCPPYEHFVFDGLDLTKWDVALFTGTGESVPHTLTRTGQGAVLSFRPDSKHYVDRRIGDYVLGFALRPDAPLGTYRIRARLVTSNKPWEGTRQGSVGGSQDRP
jgi:photosystem II stability/assembly factor-like uncharacterized protein